MKNNDGLRVLSLDELAHTTGGQNLGLALQRDRAFNDGAFLTEALRRGMAPGNKATSSRATPRRHLERAHNGWCDDGFGIVPCR